MAELAPTNTTMRLKPLPVWFAVTLRWLCVLALSALVRLVRMYSTTKRASALITKYSKMQALIQISGNKVSIRCLLDLNVRVSASCKTNASAGVTQGARGGSSARASGSASSNSSSRLNESARVSVYVSPLSHIPGRSLHCWLRLDHPIKSRNSQKSLIQFLVDETLAATHCPPISATVAHLWVNVLGE